MPNSLVKFKNEKDGNGRGKLYWGRADVDGLPFRGQSAPMLTQQEYEARVVRVADPHNGTFRTWVDEENKEYLRVLDKILNQWAQCIFTRRRPDKEGNGEIVYIEWAEYFLEDGAPAQLSNQEISYGQQPFGANPGGGPLGT